MRRKATIASLTAGLILTLLAALHLLAVSNAAYALADNPTPPGQPVRLVFIHHSTGGAWLADPNGDQPYGGLGRALMNNNYYVSATNYSFLVLARNACGASGPSNRTAEFDFGLTPGSP